ncbi:MAG: DUF3450 domain-containing protein [Pseudomonadota bacterium]
MRIRSYCVVILLTFIVVSQTSAAPAETLKTSIAIQEKVEQSAVGSQKKIDKIASEADQMLTEYKLTLRQFDSLKSYNDQVAKIISAQAEEMDSLGHQLSEIEATNQGVLPLMARMVETLDRFIALDLPFLGKERSNRLQELKLLLDRADITVSEKYRRILEAYQIEMEYGRTIEAYNGNIETDGKSRSVSFLRIGRVSLLYQTLDRKETAVWDKEKKSWQVLTEEYRTPVHQGLKIARKQVPPDLIKLPIHAPETVQ